MTDLFPRVRVLIFVFMLDWDFLIQYLSIFFGQDFHVGLRVVMKLPLLWEELFSEELIFEPLKQRLFPSVY